MATNRGELREPKTWEKIGAVLAYFAIAKDAPDVLRKLGVHLLCPASLKRALLGLHNSGDRWLLWGFTVGIAFLATTLLWAPTTKDESEAHDRDDEKAFREKWSRAARRHQWVRVIRSFGLVALREFLLDRFGVALYGTFRRPPPPAWPAEPMRYDYLDRLLFTDGSGAQYEYARNFGTLIVRNHPKGQDAYEAEESRPARWGDVRLLLIASNVFPFWLIGHLLTRPFRRAPRESDAKKTEVAGG